MSMLRIAYKLIGLLGWVLWGSLRMSFQTLVDHSTQQKHKKRQLRIKWHQSMTRLLGLDIEVRGSPNSHTQALWVANHISWLDIVAIGSQGAAFLSKAEVRSWPLIGWLGEQSGTVFIQRGGKNAAQIASQSIAEKILSGDNVLIFPEATTGTGEQVKPFHARIFAAALDHQLTVQPIALQYRNDHGYHHPKVTWIDQGFLSNLLGVLAQKRIKVKLTFLPEIDSQVFTERKRLAKESEECIRRVIVN